MDDKNISRFFYQNKEIILVGTAHVSRESADLVEKTIREEKPDTVCVELCQDRLEAIRQQERWHEMDIMKVIRDKRTSLLLAQLLMASFQRKMAQKFQVQPGEEMRRAVRLTEETGARLVLADRSIRITLLRAWRMMGFWSKIRVLPEMILSLFDTDEITEEDIEKLKEQDVLEIALKSLGEKLPALKSTLIDERDQFLARMIGEAEGQKIVAVVGAGHVPGIKANMGQDIDMDQLNRIPEKGLYRPGRRMDFFPGDYFPVRSRLLLLRKSGEHQHDPLLVRNYGNLRRGWCPDHVVASSDDPGLSCFRAHCDAPSPDCDRLGRGIDGSDDP